MISPFARLRSPPHSESAWWEETEAMTTELAKAKEREKHVLFTDW